MSTNLSTDSIKVYVSSTYKDLPEERKAVEEAIAHIKKCKYVGMEYFPVRDATPRAASLEELKGCTLYVGIFGDRYGSGITYTEYDQAAAAGLHRLLFVKSEKAFKGCAEEKPEDRANLAQFRKELLATRHVGQFDSPEQLKFLAYETLTAWLYETYLPPILDEERVRMLRGARVQLSPKAHAVLKQLRNFDFVDDKYTPLLHKGGLPVAPARYQLCRPVENFTGREGESRRLTELLLAGKHVCVSGPPGAGKTQLALHVANDLADAFYDGQLVVNMRDENQAAREPADILEECVRAFTGPEEKLAAEERQSPEEKVSRLREKYREVLSDRQVLFILDRAVSSDQLKPLLPPAGSVLLVISDEPLRLDGLESLTVGGLDEADAVKLLQRLAGCGEKPDEVREAQRICEECGYLPAAIHLAGCALKAQPRLGLKEYRQKLADELGTRGVTGLTAAARLAAVLDFSYRLLDPETQRVFRHLAVFPETFDGRAEEFVCADPRGARLAELVQRGLVMKKVEKKDKKKVEERYLMGPAERERAARITPESEPGAESEQEEAARLHAEHYRDVLAEAEEKHLRGETREAAELLDREWRNVCAGQAWAAERAERDTADVDAARLCVAYPLAGPYVLDMRQNRAESLGWLRAALRHARPEEKADLLVLLGRASLGGVGDFTLAEAESQLAACPADDYLNRARAHANCGELHTLCNQSEEAKEHFHDALKALDSCSPAERARALREKCRVLDRLGRLYLRDGKLFEAGAEFNRQLAAAKEANDPLAQFKANNNLAKLNERGGVFTAALESYAKLLDGFDEAIGRADYARTLNDCGAAEFAIGYARKALDYFRRAREAQHNAGNLYEEHLALNNLGEVYADLGQTERAVKLHTEAVEAFRGMDRPDGLAQARNSLGQTHFIAGEYDRAKESYEEALHDAERAGEDWGRHVILSNLGEALARLGETDQALDKLNEAFKFFNSRHARRYESQALANLGTAHFVRGDYEGALESYGEAVEIARDIGYLRGEAVALYNRGFTLYRRRDLPHAITHAEAALEIFERLGHRQTPEVTRRVQEWNKEAEQQRRKEAEQRREETERRRAQPRGRRRRSAAHAGAVV